MCTSGRTKGDLLRAAYAAAGGADVWAQPVSAWMARGVPGLRATDSLARAVELMVDASLRSLPVIDQDDRVEGMVSRDDLALGARRAVGGAMRTPENEIRERLRQRRETLVRLQALPETRPCVTCQAREEVRA